MTHSPELVERVAEALRTRQVLTLEAQARAALDAITETVAMVELPESMGVNGADNRVWSHRPNYVEQEFGGDVIIDDRFAVPAAELHDLGATLIAAARAAEADQ